MVFGSEDWGSSEPVLLLQRCHSCCHWTRLRLAELLLECRYTRLQRARLLLPERISFDLGDAIAQGQPPRLLLGSCVFYL